MNKRLLDFILSISEDNYDEFIKQTNLSVEGDNNLNLAPIDYSWIDIVEKYIPFLKNAVFNPYQEILDVGDSKKLYENRFLISLILKLDNFINEKYRELLERLRLSDKKELIVKSQTFLELENVEIEFKIKSCCKKDDQGSAYGLSAQERIERLLDVLQNISESSFFNSLKDVRLVGSPIHRTNVILEDQNFKKLLELWDFLENYLLIRKTFYNKKVQAKQKDSFERKLENICFINYQLLHQENLNSSTEDYYRSFLEQIIENLVKDSSMDSKTFKKIVNKKFEEAYLKKQNKKKNIQAIFYKSIDSYQKQIKDAIRCLK